MASAALQSTVGRPSDFSQGMADVICERLAKGENLRAICRTDGFPEASTVWRWRNAYPEFRSAYERAREAQAETLADELVEIADTPLIGVETTTKADGSVEKREGDMLGHRKLQIDTRKWVAAKLFASRYGEKVEHTGTVSFEALILASMKLDGPNETAPADDQGELIEGTAREAPGSD